MKLNIQEVLVPFDGKLPVTGSRDYLCTIKQGRSRINGIAAEEEQMVLPPFV